MRIALIIPVGRHEQRLDLAFRSAVDKCCTGGELANLGKELTRSLLGDRRHMAQSVVLRDRYRRRDNLALTVEGFAEARRLGAVRASEIVDLDQMQANWRAPQDFFSPFDLCRDDDPPCDKVDGEFGGTRLAIGKFAPPRRDD